MLRALKIICSVAMLVLLLAACGSAEPTLTPTNTATLVPTLTDTPPPVDTPETILPEATPSRLLLTATPEATQMEVLVEAAQGQEIPPPLDITLPDAWAQQDGTVVVTDLEGLRVLPYTVYYGPVTDGTGFITLVWGFSSVAAGSPSAETFGQFNLGSDGLRLLRLAVTDVGCVIGTDLDFDYEFPVGEHTGVGTYFQIVSCPESADTRGWFTGLNHAGINFIFYAFAEPIEAMDGAAEAELQDILDSVEFLIREADNER